MADEEFRRPAVKNSPGIARENNRKFRLPKSDVPSIPEGWVKPGSDKPT